MPSGVDSGLGLVRLRPHLPTRARAGRALTLGWGWLGSAMSHSVYPKSSGVDSGLGLVRLTARRVAGRVGVGR